MEEIKVIKSEKIKIVGYDALEIVIDYPIQSNKYLMGIDPGTRNLGIAWKRPQKSFMDDYDNNDVHLYQIALERSLDPVTRIVLASSIMDYFQYANNVTIEGAAYGFAVGAREELAEQRAAFVLTLRNRGIKNVQISAPNSIRKGVFGNGRAKAHEFWQLSGIKKANDALAALSCLIYSDLTYL